MVAYSRERTQVNASRRRGRVKEPTGFISVPEWGRTYFTPPLGRARAYELAHELGLALRLGERKLVIPRRALEELTAGAVERARQITDQPERGYEPALESES
jgi:hypothetical protein